MFVCVFVSQPFAAERSQSPVPAGHMAIDTPQTPTLQTATAPTGGAGHRRPQAPQLFTSEARRLVSQPSPATSSQLPKPAVQVKPQAPDMQVGVAFALASQVTPHPPQFAGSARASRHLPSHAV